LGDVTRLWQARHFAQDNMGIFFAVWRSEENPKVAGRWRFYDHGGAEVLVEEFLPDGRIPVAASDPTDAGVYISSLPKNSPKNCSQERPQADNAKEDSSICG